MNNLSKMFHRFLEHVVEEHNQWRLREGKDFVAKDMVDVLLQIADDPTLEVELDRESVKAFTQVSYSVFCERCSVYSSCFTREHICKHGHFR